MSVFKLPSVTFKPAAFLSGAPGPWAGHLPFAYDLVAALKPNLIVELGVFYGDSYFGFCQAVSEHQLPCTCYGIDTWRGDAHGGYYEDAVYDAVIRYNDKAFSSFSYLLKSTFDESLPRFSEESIDLLHIDGFHTYEAVRRDFESWYPKVKAGGIILFHDISVRSQDFGVWRFWEELEREHRTFGFRHSNGLGVLLKERGERQLDPLLNELFWGSEETREALRRYYAASSERLQLEFRSGTAATAEAGNSILQVFFCSDKEYTTDENSYRIVASGKKQEVRLSLPSGLNKAPLRIDPTNRPAIIDVSSIRLLTPDGYAVWSCESSTDRDQVRVGGTALRLPSENSLLLFSYGNDPQIYLPQITKLSDYEHLDLEVRLLVDLEFTAVRQMAEKLLQIERDHESALKALLEETRTFRLAYEESQGTVEEIRRFQLSVIQDRERVWGDRSMFQREVEKLTSELTASRTGEAKLRSELDKLQGELQQRERTGPDDRASHSAMKSELVKLRADLEKEQARSHQLQASKSWRITKPLRSFAGVFRSGNGSEMKM